MTVETLSLQKETTQSEVGEVSRGVTELQNILNNTQWEQTVLNEKVKAAVPEMRVELSVILADSEKRAQLEQALKVWGDCKGNKTGRAFYKGLKDDALVHSGVYHWFTNAAVKGKNRFSYTTIQDFIDFSLNAQQVVAGEADQKEVIVHRTSEKAGKVLARKGEWVYIAKQQPGEEPKLITAIPGFYEKRFEKLVGKEKRKQGY